MNEREGEGFPVSYRGLAFLATYPGQTGPQALSWAVGSHVPLNEDAPPQGRSESRHGPHEMGIGGKIQHQTAGRRFQGCPVLVCQEYQRATIVNHSFQLIYWLSSLSLHGMSSAASGGP